MKILFISILLTCSVFVFGKDYKTNNKVDFIDKELLNLAKSNDVVAQYQLSQKYFDMGMIEKSLEWSLKAANKGYSDAEYFVGKLYMGNDGITKDKEKALYWLSKSTESGNPVYQYYLGELYYRGEIFEKNYDFAFDLLLESSKQQYAPAIALIGELYLTGSGVEKDYTNAYIWFKMTELMGYDNDEFIKSLRVFEKDFSNDYIHNIEQHLKEKLGKNLELKGSVPFNYNRS